MAKVRKYPLDLNMRHPLAVNVSIILKNGKQENESMSPITLFCLRTVECPESDEKNTNQGDFHFSKPFYYSAVNEHTLNESSVIFLPRQFLIDT